LGYFYKKICHQELSKSLNLVTLITVIKEQVQAVVLKATIKRLGILIHQQAPMHNSSFCTFNGPCCESLKAQKYFME